ncbi:hypothetical protein Phou_016220 [Phytohabitans houttuyneae]|uniref:Uncharacterized protein n=1 Tax=Phytohabitans houttuyneae TaxID=1076126 RepID=A0A6V8JXJ0_9ACTN|nr:hypothetical protein Phou_016220 [Phytohabitans houttuyneae]
MHDGVPDRGLPQRAVDELVDGRAQVPVPFRMPRADDPVAGGGGLSGGGGQQGVEQGAQPPAGVERTRVRAAGALRSDAAA